MNYIGILGLVVLIGIAFLISKDKKAIKLRTVVWGLALQLTFAAIILSEFWLSFAAMFAFISLINIYLFEAELEKQDTSKWITGGLVVLLSAVVTAAAYFSDFSQVVSYSKTGDLYTVMVDGETYPKYEEELGGYDEVFFRGLIKTDDGNSFAIGYMKNDKSYVRVDGNVFGPFDAVSNIYAPESGDDWMIECVQTVEYTMDNGEEIFSETISEMTYQIGDAIYSPDELFIGETFDEDGEPLNFDVSLIDGYDFGGYTAATSYRIGGIHYITIAILLILAIVFSQLKKKNEKYKDSLLPKIFFAVLLLVSLGTVWARGIYGQAIMASFSSKIEAFLSLTDLGTAFLFEGLSNLEFITSYGFNFAIGVLPTIIFFSAFMAILYHFGIIQVVVSAMAKFMRWTMGTSGSETLSVSSNIFVGQTEAPLLVKPYLAEMTKSELHAIMVGGFATIAGGVLAGYIKMGVPAGHLIAASVMSAPAALMMAKIIYPETEHSATAGDVDMPNVGSGDNLLGAAANGVADGLSLALNVGAMLIAFIALIGFVDMILGGVYSFLDGIFHFNLGEFPEPNTLQSIFGYLLFPLSWAMGSGGFMDSFNVAALLGTKVAVNEFVAYGMLANHIAAGTLGAKGVIIATYALCGFANFSSIGIQIGGIGALVPERRSEIAGLAMLALVGGALASWTTAVIAGLLL